MNLRTFSIWTRGMRDIVLHDAFVLTGCGPDVSPVQAVSVGSEMWSDDGFVRRDNPLPAI